MMELTILSVTDEVQEERFDFSVPETILFEIVGPHDDNPTNLDWKNWSIETCTVIGGKEGVTGAASYQREYGGFLDYTVQNMIDCPGKEGWFAIENVTGYYHKGDGWMTDDDMELYIGGVRPATADEVAQA